MDNSPQIRSARERLLNRKTTALFIAVSGGIWVAILWDAMLPAKQSPPSPIDSEVTDQRLSDAAAGDKLLSDAAWRQQATSLSRELAKGDFNQPLVRKQLAELEQLLHHPPREIPTSLTGKLSSLQQHIDHLRSPAQPTTVNLAAVSKQVQQTQQELRRTEADAQQQAINAARDAVSQERYDELRTARLQAAEQADRIENLNQEIAAAQRRKAKEVAEQRRADALAKVMPDVRRYLVAFTSEGHRQPGVEARWESFTTVDAMPVSYSKLVDRGALEDTMEGLELLFIFGGGKNRGVNNDRPLGAFPKYSAGQLNKPEVLNAVKRAQQLLREHGKALVEAHRLSP